jgi:hypothetical protein
MKTQNLSQIKKASLGALTLALLSACGSSGITGAGTITSPNTDNNQQYVVETPSTNGIEFQFSVYGDNPSANSIALRTDNKLIITAYAGSAGRNNGTVAPPTNFSAEYNCATYRVTLQEQRNGVYYDVTSLETPPLTVTGTSGCDNSVASRNLDFSPYLSPGHGLVRVKVEALKSDFTCKRYKNCMSSAQLYWGSGCSFARLPNAQQDSCPMKPVWKSHTVTGTMFLQVN